IPCGSRSCCRGSDGNDRCNRRRRSASHDQTINLKMKPFATLLTLAIVAGVQAQPVLTFQENAPVPGTSYLLHFGPFVDPGSAGADQTWDMIGLTTDSTMNITLAAPGTVIGNEAFPGATVAETGNEATMFWRAENDG